MNRVLIALAYGSLICLFSLPSQYFAQTQPQAGKARSPKRATITSAGEVDYARDIHPIFASRCYQCHGPQTSMGQLRLDSRTLTLKGGISGKVIIPENSKGSRLVHRILGLGGEERMPLKGDPLTGNQIALIERWIDQGAPWPDQAPGEADGAGGGVSGTDAKPQKHWAYIRPGRPEIPVVRNAAWVRNPIDAFVLARLEKEGITPSPEASRETLIRRVSLDLTGLPPTLKEVDEFVADRSPDAYEKVVDRLLASPHYGERWARHWLDLARYADTNGYEKDRRRSMWKYRDWVINAFNQDMPFDQFTIEQTAGDVLPNATTDQRIATGFHRNTMFNEEGGVDQEESRWQTILDRVNTTATVWLGTTLACAQCHDHKYDPFSQKEYYQFFAFFNNTDYHFEGNPKISEQKLIEPKLELPTAEQEARRQEIQAEITKLDKILETSTPELEAGQRDWEREVSAAQSDWVTLDPVEFRSTGGANLTKLGDGSLLVSGLNSVKDTYIVLGPTDLREITALRLEALADPRLPQGGPGRDPYGNFFLTGLEAEIAPQSDPVRFTSLIFSNAVADDSQRGFEARNLIIKRESRGWAIDATRESNRLTRQAVLVADKPFGSGQPAMLRVRLKHESGFVGLGIGRFRLSVTTAKDPTAIVKVSAGLRPILGIPIAARTERQTKDLAEYYKSFALTLKPARDRRASLQAALDRLDITSTLVMQERLSYERPSTYIRLRGSFLSKGEKVFAALPAALHPLPESELPNRLGLARWLIDESNPLVTRVTVNRFWEQFFGRGIVETSEDFGTQGERPSHPEVLDWLATEFMQGWKIKALHRLIVTSATYRQSSKITPALLDRDPYNRLLARGPRFRMEAEMIRDAALCVSGLLSRKIGGPSVFPPQPDGIWDIPYNDDRWRTSDGEDRYRRGLYTFVRRTSPYPSLTVFDAPSREFCAVRRPRTNTPLQALTTLNDPAFFEAAAALARRIVTEAATDVPSRAAYGFRLCVARQPAEAEINLIVDLYKQQLARFAWDPNAAQKLTKWAGSPPGNIAELAAWTMVSNVLLNLDETLTKE